MTWNGFCAVRAAVGADLQIGVDANGGWPTPQIAIETIERLREFDIRFVEQPVPAGDAEAMAQVRRTIGIPIIADESVYTLDRRAGSGPRGGVRCLLHLRRQGRRARARPMRIADFAASLGLKCTVGSNLELGVGSAAMIHLAMAHPRDPSRALSVRHHRPPFLPGRYSARAAADYSRSRPAPHKGLGLGSSLIRSKVERYRIA